MASLRFAATAVFLAWISMLPIGAGAQDWSSCASDLDSLRRRSSDASSAAEDADSKKREFDNAAEDYRRCRSMPDLYDVFKDGCRMKRSSAEMARTSYEMSLTSL